jgi:hypothetical protein
MRRMISGAAALACALLGLHLTPAQACSIDGKPTLTVNGYDVVINKQVPAAGANLQLWAPFVLTFPLHTGRQETMAEITQAVPLPVIAFKTPWRWSFGDGSPVAHGMKVQHVFKKPGTYKVTVDAFFPPSKVLKKGYWYTFDAVQVRVLPG